MAKPLLTIANKKKSLPYDRLKIIVQSNVRPKTTKNQKIGRLHLGRVLFGRTNSFFFPESVNTTYEP